MRKVLYRVSVLSLLIGLFLGGCSSTTKTARLANLALEASNREAKRVYQVEPFSSEDGELRELADLLVWEGLSSQAGHDFVAKVTLRADETVIAVEVQMLAHPIEKPPTNPRDDSALDGIDEKPSAIPEVIERKE